MIITQSFRGVTYIVCKFKSPWLNDTIWRHRSWSTLAKVMACCLSAPSHYLYQYWLTIKGVPWRPPVRKVLRSAHELNLQHVFGDNTFAISTLFPRDQRDKVWPKFYHCHQFQFRFPGAVLPLRWRHNGHAGVSNHQSRDCLLNRLFRRRSKKTSKLRVTGLCAGNSPGTGEFPAQRASYAENVSIWWRHHANID